MWWAHHTRILSESRFALGSNLFAPLLKVEKDIFREN
jgi:hypothetical protein